MDEVQFAMTRKAIATRSSSTALLVDDYYVDDW